MVKWSEGDASGTLELAPFGAVKVVMSARGVPLDYVVKLALREGVARGAKFFAQQHAAAPATRAPRNFSVAQDNVIFCARVRNSEPALGPR